MNISANVTVNTIPEWVYIEQVVYSGIIALIGIPGNILIILVFANSQEKVTTDYMVFSMAISDLFGSTICTSLNILGHIPSLWVTIRSEWFCRARHLFSILAGAIPSWILGVVALDRYLKICRPFSNILTIPRIKKLCIIIYMLVTSFIVPSVLNEHFDLSSGACLYIASESVWTIFIYTISILCGVSYIVTAIAYTRVAIALCTRLRMKYKRSYIRKGITDENKRQIVSRKEEISSMSSTDNFNHIGNNTVLVAAKQTYAADSNTPGKFQIGRQKDGLLKEQKKVNRTTLIMFLITLMNILSFVFVFVGNELAKNKLYPPGEKSKVLGYTIRTTYMMSYIANPLLYIMMSSKFRESVKQLYSCFREL